MGIKKIARPINQTKNKFMVWLKENNANNIDEYVGVNDDDNDFDYYSHISAFIGNDLYSVYFTMWEGEVKITYSDGHNRYLDMSIYDFLQLIN